MLSISCIGLKPADLGEIRLHTTVRFKDQYMFTAPEALILHEQHYVEDEVIDRLCEEAYGCKLYKPARSYVPSSIVAACAGLNMVPVQYNSIERKITCVMLKEFKNDVMPVNDLDVEIVFTPTYYYFDMYTLVYGANALLAEVAPKTLVDAIVSEAVNLGAQDITISTKGTSGHVYFKVRKRLVNSQRLFSADIMREVIQYISVRSPYDFESRKPKHLSMDISPEFRARVVINNKFKGYSITMRLSPNEAFHATLESLNLTAKTVRFMKEQFMDSANGLRLIVGETSSGKNWTALAALSFELAKRPQKCVSIEYPVEQEIEGIEQIECETIEEYKDDIHSLLRQSPDIVYVTEMNDDTGAATLEVTNTGKRVISTAHADSLEDAITRVMDICKMSSDRIIQSLHSIVYQNLVRDDDKDKLFPVNSFIRLTPDIKDILYGKPIGEVIALLRDSKEEG